MNHQRILIFSYNRGLFLENAVGSVLQHFTDPNVTVIDDYSNDQETLDILARLRRDAEVLNPPRVTNGHKRTGGLHHAMNFAFDLCEDRGEDVVLVLQDDMQIVRDVNHDEIVKASSFFGMPSSSFVLGCTFCKTYSGTRNAHMYRDGAYYFRTLKSTKLATTYMDTGLFSIQRLRQTVGHLTVGEIENQERAAAAGLRTGFMTMPFMSFLPFPISYRKGTRNWRAQLLDKVSGAGIHTLQPLTGSELTSFLERDPDMIPFDEDWLTAPTVPECKYWSHAGGRNNAKARGGWRWALGKLL